MLAKMLFSCDHVVQNEQQIVTEVRSSKARVDMAFRGVQGVLGKEHGQGLRPRSTKQKTFGNQACVQLMNAHRDT